MADAGLLTSSSIWRRYCRGRRRADHPPGRWKSAVTLKARPGIARRVWQPSGAPTDRADAGQLQLQLGNMSRRWGAARTCAALRHQLQENTAARERLVNSSR